MKRLLYLLAFLWLAAPAWAQFAWLDDPALTTGDSADRVMIVASAVNSTQSSIAFTAPGAEAGVFTIAVSACVGSCSLQLKLETQDPDGTWYSVYTPTATGTITPPASFRYFVGGRQNSNTGTEFTLATFTRLPPKFRVSVLFAAGTSATYNVEGVVW